jgi:hypothetical protein
MVSKSTLPQSQAAVKAPTEPSVNGHAENGRALNSPTPRGKNDTARPPPDEPPEPPELALEEDLMGAIGRDLVALGIVGEEDAALSLYIIGTSRLLDRPLSAIVRGDSSSGKSFLINTVATLFPPEHVLLATRMTPQALYHLPDPVSHKFVVGGERSLVQDENTADATAALRQLRSDGKITKQITEKVGNGFVTVEVTVEGPIAFVESTTLKKDKIFGEDLNRGLLLRTDESERQTRRVIHGQARGYMLPDEPIDTAAAATVRERHHAFQRCLERVGVHIPFADVLAKVFPAHQVQARRGFQQLLAMIEAVTLLHQHHRSRDEHGCLRATDADYAIARKLLLKPLGESVGLTDGGRKTYELLRGKFPQGFDTTAAQQAGNFASRMACHRALRELSSLGLIRCVAQGSSHRPARWAWTGKAMDELVLPGVGAVFGAPAS